MIGEVHNAIKTTGWSEKKTEILDVRDLATLKDGTFTHVITNLGLPVPGDINSSPKNRERGFSSLEDRRCFCDVYLGW